MYSLRLIEREGQEYVDGIYADKNKIVKLHQMVEELFPKYQKLAKEL